MNRIVKVELELMVALEGTTTDAWLITITKEFAEEHGGGSQEFKETARGVHAALDMAKSMVTLMPTRRAE